MYAYTTHGKLPPAVCCMFESSVPQVDPPHHPQPKPALKLPLSNASMMVSSHIYIVTMSSCEVMLKDTATVHPAMSFIYQSYI